MTAIPAPAILRIGLRQFRSYRDAHIECDHRPVCIIGPNGTGKTNLLEAISMLAIGRGLRRATLTDLTHNASNPSAGWNISVRFRQNSQTRHLAMKLRHSPSLQPKRSISLDDTPISPANLSDLFNLIWLTPAHDRVLANARSERRRFFDRLILARYPHHAKTSATYDNAMRQRNTLLLKTRPEHAWLDAIECRMANAGANIAQNRVNAIAELQYTLNTSQTENFPTANINLSGTSENLAGQGANLLDITHNIKTTLLKNRTQDAQAGRTTDGIHRSDFNVTHPHSKTVAALCSSGEKKALLLAVVIAAAQTWLGDDTQRISLLLLDDATSHLDSERRNALCNRLANLNTQCWISATDYSMLAGFGQRAQFFSIHNNSIQNLKHNETQKKT